LDCCAGARIPVAARTQVFGPADKVLPPAIDVEGIGLLALQLPPGRLSRSLLQLIRASKAGVLLYKDAGGGMGL
jgi:hypothetical protein